MNNNIQKYIGATFKGIGQVMFQDCVLAGLIFFVGIIVGAIDSDMPYMAVGAVVGLIVSTIIGFLISERSEAEAGLCGFNGILVGCALPLFLPAGWQMWTALVAFAALTVPVRHGLNVLMQKLHLNSLTIPFVLLTWVALLLMSRSTAPQEVELLSTAKTQISIWALVESWLKGISQVFLIDSPTAGLLFLLSLALSHFRAAVWGAVASAVSLVVAFIAGFSADAVAAGLYGFSPVLTAIAIGNTKLSVGALGKIAIVMSSIIFTMAVQLTLESLLSATSLPVMTAPFCIATWIFLLGLRKSQKILK